jgi:hypothetical protein
MRCRTWRDILRNTKATEISLRRRYHRILRIRSHILYFNSWKNAVNTKIAERWVHCGCA